MAKCNRVEDLEESRPDEFIITGVEHLFRDAGKEIALGTILHHHVRSIVGFQDLEQGHHVRVMADRMVQLDLSLLEPTLPRVQAYLVQSLDREIPAGNKLPCDVDSAVRAHAQNGIESVLSA